MVVFRTLQTRVKTWQGISKGYTTTQYYGITHSTEPGVIIGGTQDNGTLVVLDNNANDPQVGYSVFGNDGIDCDMSQEIAVVFASSQNGLVVRVDLTNAAENQTQPPFAFFSQMNSGGPFHTVVKLWESTDDPTSKDSIEFSVEPTEIAISTGNGILRNFNETVTPLQPAAKVIKSSIMVASGESELVMASDNKTLEGDGEGEVTFNSDGSFDVNVTFDDAPAANSNVFVIYEEKFDANDVLILESNNLKSLQGSYTFEHRLETSLKPGDKILVQDPVQSYLFSTGDGQPSAGGNIRFYRNVLNAQALPPDPIGISGVGGGVTCIETTNDGDVAFIGTGGGSVFRVSGLKDVYTQEDADALSPQNVVNIGGGVTGIAIDPNDNNRLIVTGGGYGTADRVRYTTNALDPTPSFTNVHGDMPPFPVYDAEFIVEDPTNNSSPASIVLLGTEFGIWGTSDVSAGAVTWSDVNSDMSWVPVYDIRQQALPFEKANNSGMIYVGTHGRGFWSSTDLVGIDDVEGSLAEDAVSDFKVYPNPMQSEGRIDFSSGFNGNVTVSIYDMHGRRVKSWQRRVASGPNTMPFSVIDLQSGAYFATIETENSREVAKFMVMK